MKALIAGGGIGGVTAALALLDAGIDVELYERNAVFGEAGAGIPVESVDATSVLFNKQELAGVDGLKRHLLADRQDQFARAMVHKMSVYALGRPLTFADHADVDGLTARFRKKEDRLADMIHLIVSSNLFNSK